MYIAVDGSRCTGCRICEVVCSRRRCGESNPARSAIRVIRRSRYKLFWPVIHPYGGVTTSRAATAPPRCDACGRCAEFCPTGALKKRRGQFVPAREFDRVRGALKETARR